MQLKKQIFQKSWTLIDESAWKKWYQNFSLVLVQRNKLTGWKETSQRPQWWMARAWCQVQTNGDVVNSGMSTQVQGNSGAHSCLINQRRFGKEEDIFQNDWMYFAPEI